MLTKYQFQEKNLMLYFSQFSYNLKIQSKSLINLLY